MSGLGGDDFDLSRFIDKYLTGSGNRFACQETGMVEKSNFMGPGIQAAATRTFGLPLRTYHADGYTILVWDANLLAALG